MWRTIVELWSRTHEDLQEQSRSQDMQIQSLLDQLDQLRTQDKIIYWTSRLQGDASFRRYQSVVEEIGKRIGFSSTRIVVIWIFSLLHRGERLSKI